MRGNFLRVILGKQWAGCWLLLSPPVMYGARVLGVSCAALPMKALVRQQVSDEVAAQGKYMLGRFSAPLLAHREHQRMHSTLGTFPRRSCSAQTQHQVHVCLHRWLWCVGSSLDMSH